MADYRTIDCFTCGDIIYDNYKHERRTGRCASASPTKKESTTPMAETKLFQFAVIKHPADPKKGKSELVVPLTEVLAADVNAATLLAARAIPEEHVDDLDLIQVVVSPF